MTRRPHTGFDYPPGVDHPYGSDEPRTSAMESSKITADELAHLMYTMGREINLTCPFHEIARREVPPDTVFAMLVPEDWAEKPELKKFLTPPPSFVTLSRFVDRLLLAIGPTAACMQRHSRR